MEERGEAGLDLVGQLGALVEVRGYDVVRCATVHDGRRYVVQERGAT
jgi:hypothetical protein